MGTCTYLYFYWISRSHFCCCHGDIMQTRAEVGSAPHEWEKRGAGNTLKHREYEFRHSVNSCVKTAVLKTLTFSFAGLSFLPSPSQAVLYCLQLLSALHSVSSKSDYPPATSPVSITTESKKLYNVPVYWSAISKCELCTTFKHAANTN